MNIIEYIDDNMNNMEIISADKGFEPLKDFSCYSEKEIKIYFRNLENKLIEHIKKAEIILGCIAWLTNFKILDAMAKCRTSIVVQKEDFIRPDIYSKSNFKNTLRKKYEAIDRNIERYEFENFVSGLSYACSSDIDTVRCVGNFNRDKKPANPRMHNKFLIFANEVEKTGDYFGKISPYAVWTGSFNFTKNATMSFENALYITNKKIVDSYFNEYSQILALSEPLDWSEDWAAPEWRIGS